MTSGTVLCLLTALSWGLWTVCLTSSTTAFIEPEALRRFAFDVVSVGDELIVGPRRSVDHYHVVLKTTKPI